MSNRTILAVVLLALSFASLLKYRLEWQLASPYNIHFNKPGLQNGCKFRLLSFDPFMAHIEDFVTASERNHILRLALPLLERSKVTSSDGSKHLSAGRTSSTAKLPKSDPIVLSILHRAANIQGYRPIDHMEIQVTSYETGGEYGVHFDWHKDRSSSGLTDRATTFFVILEAPCTGCGTRFPMVPTNWTQRDRRLCEFVDCEENVFTTKPVPGSALFWRNLNDDGSGNVKTAHAGLMAHGGHKIGLNIWTRINVTSPSP